MSGALFSRWQCRLQPSLWYLVTLQCSALSVKPMRERLPTSGNYSWLDRYRSWRSSQSNGYRKLHDRPCRYWRCKLARGSQHLHPCSFSTSEPVGWDPQTQQWAVFPTGNKLRAMNDWWQAFFDADYLRLWGQSEVSGSIAAQVEGLWSLLGLQEGSRVLDAPCGYGRLSRPLAERGAIVLGVDQSQALLECAERERGGLPSSRLRYLQHDLRKPLGEEGFDCALNVFTSLGYGTEEDDLAILETLRAAVPTAPGWHPCRRGPAVRPNQRPHGDLLVLVRPSRTGKEAGLPACVHGDGTRPAPRARRASISVRPSRLLPGAF